MSGFYDALLEVLKQDTRLFSKDGEFLRNVAFELSYKADPELLKLLLSSDVAREQFFVDVDGIMVFDKQRLGWVVSNREFLPDSFTRFKNTIGLVDQQGRSYTQTQDVELVWAYKDCWLEGGQTKDQEQRLEVFYNEVLAPDEVDRLLEPKVLTSATRYTASGEAPTGDFSLDDNLILKGNNLLGLSSLLERYVGRVKMVYTDPPYNPRNKTNNTFCYNNRFNRSTWLTFMANRIRLAKRLLRPDGVLVMAIDDNEQPYLGVLLREFFPEHEVHCITIVHNPRGVQGTNFSYTHEYAFFVIPKGLKSIGDRVIEDSEIDWRNLRDNGGESLRTDAATCFYPVIVENGEIVGFGDVLPDDEHPEDQMLEVDGKQYIYPIDGKGIERKWRYGREGVEKVEHLLRARVVRGKRTEVEIGKDFGSVRTVWSGARYDANEYGTKLVRSLVPDAKFDFPKSLWNVYDCIHAVVADDPDAIVMDFFGGSGTTGHAVLELNKVDGGQRRFVLVEQMDYAKTITARRVAKVIENNGDGSFVYCELKQLNQQFAAEISAATKTEELLALWEEISQTGFVSYRVLPSEFDAATFEELSFEDQQRVLIATLDKNVLYVNLGDLENGDFAVSDEDKAFNRSFYALGDES